MGDSGWQREKTGDNGRRATTGDNGGANGKQRERAGDSGRQRETGDNGRQRETTGGNGPATDFGSDTTDSRSGKSV